MLIPLQHPSQHASHELDYLYRQQPYGSPAPTADAKDRELFVAVKAMKDDAPRLARVKHQYDRTLAALNRMRKARGRKAIRPYKGSARRLTRRCDGAEPLD